MKTINARFRSSARIPVALDKEAALKRIADIAATPGGLTVEKVLRERTKKDSPLKILFTSSKDDAAETTWKREASDIVGFVVITVVDDDGSRCTARRWIGSNLSVVGNDDDDNRSQRTYHPIEEVWTDERLMEEQRTNALMGLRKWCDQWAFLRKDFKDIFAFIEKRTSATEKKRA